MKHSEVRHNSLKSMRSSREEWNWLATHWGWITRETIKESSYTNRREKSSRKTKTNGWIALMQISKPVDYLFTVLQKKDRDWPLRKWPETENNWNDVVEKSVLETAKGWQYDMTYYIYCENICFDLFLISSSCLFSHFCKFMTIV